MPNPGHTLLDFWIGREERGRGGRKARTARTPVHLVAGMENTMSTMIAKSSSPGPYRSRPQDVDRHVGTRMRERRIMLGLTQQQMAELIGVTYQQAHKYEKGINRVASGRLYNIAQALGVDVGYFFEGLESDKPLKARAAAAAAAGVGA
jgi:DNA-binding XRE family transcriptional regulator